jgi:hypothetical protein
LLRLVQWRGHLEATTWCQRKLDEATSLLQRPQTLPTRWRAELDETRATVDQRVGGSKEQARTAAATASAVWARLGQPRRRAKIADSYELGVAEPGADQDVELRMWFGEGGFDSADVYAEVAAEGMSEPVDRIGHVVVFGELATQMHDSSARLRHISRLIAFEWERWATGVGGSLAVSTLSEALQQYEGGLRLVTGQAELAAMPWESLSPPHFNGQTLSHALQPRLVYRCVDVSQRQEREVTAAQAALGRLGFFTARIDGLVGAATRAAVSQFQRTCGLRSSGTLTSDTWHQLRAHVVAAAAERPLRVLIVAPSNGRGKTDLSALAELTALYANRGASVQTIELADLLRAGRALAGASEERPDVVHVLATVDLVGGNVVIESSAELDLGRTGSFGLDQLSVTVLGDFLATVSREGFGPAIVIETPWRPSRAEAARSLLLRNVLGQSLLTLGRTEAILCTGGASPKRRRSHREIIAEALVERCDLGQVSARLQLGAGWGSGLEDAVSRLGSALFLERSPHTLFPVGTG